VASRRQVAWRPAVGRTAGSGDPRRTTECEERELAVIEKRQNRANLLVVLVIDILRLMTNQGGYDQENKPNFRTAAWGSGEPRRPQVSWRENSKTSTNLNRTSVQYR